MHTTHNIADHKNLYPTDTDTKASIFVLGSRVISQGCRYTLHVRSGSMFGAATLLGVQLRRNVLLCAAEPLFFGGFGSLLPEGSRPANSRLPAPRGVSAASLLPCPELPPG